MARVRDKFIDRAIGFVIHPGVFLPFIGVVIVTRPFGLLQLAFALLLIPTGCLLARDALRTGTPSIVAKIITAYLMATISFSGLYYTIFFFAPTAFAFSSGVISEADVIARESALTGAAREFRRYALLLELKKWTAQKPPDELERLIRQRNGAVWKLDDRTFAKHYFTHTRYGFDATLDIRDVLGSERFGGTGFSVDGSLVRDLTESANLPYQDYIRRLDALFNWQARQLDVTLGILRSPSIKHAFGLFDFVYFSIVTITTVGYGDIVPNSTLVRIVVASQIILGLVLIARLSSASSP